MEESQFDALGGSGFEAIGVVKIPQEGQKCIVEGGIILNHGAAIDDAALAEAVRHDFGIVRPLPGWVAVDG